MKNFRSILVILLSAPLLTVGQTPEKIMLKSFNLDGKSQILLQVPGNVDVKHWDKTTAQIQITVNLPNGQSAMLNELANVGRYNLTAKDIDGQLVISAENLAKIIKIKGQDLKENISFVVFAPKETSVKILDTSTAALHKK